MAEKPKKVAVNESAAKKTVSLGGTVKTVKAEVVSPAPDLMPRKVMKQISDVEAVVS